MFGRAYWEAGVTDDVHRQADLREVQGDYLCSVVAVVASLHDPELERRQRRDVDVGRLQYGQGLGHVVLVRRQIPQVVELGEYRIFRSDHRVQPSEEDGVGYGRIVDRVHDRLSDGGDVRRRPLCVHCYAHEHGGLARELEDSVLARLGLGERQILAQDAGDLGLSAREVRVAGDVVEVRLHDHVLHVAGVEVRVGLYLGRL